MSPHHVPSHSTLNFVADAFVKVYKFQPPVYSLRWHASWHVSRYQMPDSDHWQYQTESFDMNHIYPLFSIKTYYPKFNLLGGKYRCRVPVYLPVLLSQFRRSPDKCHKCSTTATFPVSLFAIHDILLFYAQRSVIWTAFTALWILKVRWRTFHFTNPLCVEYYYVCKDLFKQIYDMLMYVNVC
jgi:hypothetical protein